MVLGFGAPKELLRTYEQERKPVAIGVVETSGELVRCTRYSRGGTHADDYVRIVGKRAGYITGMGIRYGSHALHGTRLLDFMVRNDGEQADTRIYSLLDYRFFTLLVFGDCTVALDLPPFVKVIRIHEETSPYANQMILVRPDSYIAASSFLSDVSPITVYFDSSLSRTAAWNQRLQRSVTQVEHMTPGWSSV